MPWGGARPGAGRKIGKHRRRLSVGAVTAGAILASIDEVAKWRELIEATRVVPIGDGKTVEVPDHGTRLSAMSFLTQMRDGRPYQQVNPSARLPGAGHDPKLAAVLENILPPGNSLTLTQLKVSDESRELECAKPKKQRKTKAKALPQPATIDANACNVNALSSDPSSRKDPGGHSARESHPDFYQDSGRKVP